MDKIDFVLPWVDGSDPRWLAEKRSYENSGEAMARGDEDANAIAINNSGVLKTGLDVERLVWRNIWKFVDLRALGVARAVKNINNQRACREAP